jgi:hypothetical protein
MALYLCQILKRRFTYRIHLTALLILPVVILFSSCRTSKTKKPFEMSTTTDFYNAERFEKRKKTSIRLLYAYNTNKVLYGNPCATEVTRSFGFEYIPAFDSADEPRNDLAIWVHNFTNSVAIAFRYGPFWKRKVKKRIRYCAETSGDFNG